MSIWRLLVILKSHENRWNQGGRHIRRKKKRLIRNRKNREECSTFLSGVNWKAARKESKKDSQSGYKEIGNVYWVMKWMPSNASIWRKNSWPYWVWLRSWEDGRNMAIGFGSLGVISNFDEPISWTGRDGSQIWVTWGIPDGSGTRDKGSLSVFLSGFWVQKYCSMILVVRIKKERKDNEGGVEKSRLFRILTAQRMVLTEEGSLSFERGAEGRTWI